MSQTLEETHRKKLTRLGKGLGRQKSILFSSLLPWFSSQVGNTGKQEGSTPWPAGTTWRGGFPHSPEPFESCLLPNPAPKSLHGVWRERLLPTHSPSYFALIFLTLSHIQSCRASLSQRKAPLGSEGCRASLEYPSFGKCVQQKQLVQGPSW